MKKVTLLFMLLVVSMYTIAGTDNSNEVIKNTTEAVTSVSNSVNGTLANVDATVNNITEKTAPIAQSVNKASESVAGLADEASEKIRTLNISDSTLTEAERIIDKYGTEMKDVIVSIFNTAKEPAKKLFDLFVKKVQIFAIVDATVGIMFTILGLMFLLFAWRGVKHIIREQLKEEKVAPMQIIMPVVNVIIGLTFTIVSFNYMADANQIALDAFVPEYQAIKDVAGLFNDSTTETVVVVNK